MTSATMTKDTTYQGWANRATWNVALYINNDQGLYELAKDCECYQDFADILTECGTTITPDGFSFTDPTLDHDELDEVIFEITD